MTINNEQKQKLRKILDDISTPEERVDLAKQDKLENIQNSVKDVGSFGKALEGIKDFFNQRIDRVENKVKNIKPTDLSPLLEVLTETKNILSKPQKQQDMSGFFKDLGTQLVQFGTSTKNTEEIIRNLKWNSTMGIKNRNGSPINPSISSFGITDFDDIKISGYDVNNNPATVTYYLSGNQQAVLSLTYDVNGNITEAKRTS
jgi:hypothetical protein